jgi:hypothetical protein
MSTKKIEQDLREAGLRKKRARKVAKAAERSHAGDRAARELVEQHAAALRDSISAAVSHAKPPRAKPAQKAPAKQRSARKRSAPKTPTRKAGAA